MRLRASIRPAIPSLIAVSPACFLQSPAAGIDEQPIQEFIPRWSNSGGAERANYQLFLAELCDVLQVARPEPTVEDDCRNAYVFERNVQFDNLDGTHTVFGRVVRGLEVLAKLQRRDPPTPESLRINPNPNIRVPPADKIIEAKVLRKRDHPYRPRVWTVAPDKG